MVGSNISITYMICGSAGSYISITYMISGSAGRNKSITYMKNVVVQVVINQLHI